MIKRVIPACACSFLAAAMLAGCVIAEHDVRRRIHPYVAAHGSAQWAIGSGSIQRDGPDDESLDESGPAFGGGIAAGVRLGALWALEASWAASRYQGDSPSVGGFTVHSLEANLQFRINTYSPSWECREGFVYDPGVPPRFVRGCGLAGGYPDYELYIQLGFGLPILAGGGPELKSLADRTSGAGLNAGVGYDYWITPQFTLGGRLLWRFFRRESTDRVPDGELITYEHHLFSLDLVVAYHFT